MNTEWSTPGPSRGAAEKESLTAPAIVILIISGLQCALWGLATLLLLVQVLTGHQFGSEPMSRSDSIGSFFVALFLLGAHLPVLYGTVQMLKGRSKGWAMFAAIAMMIPCLGPCCLVGLPVGIWALITVNKVPLSAWGDDAERS